MKGLPVLGFIGRYLIGNEVIYQGKHSGNDLQVQGLKYFMSRIEPKGYPWGVPGCNILLYVP